MRKEDVKKIIYTVLVLGALLIIALGVSKIDKKEVPDSQITNFEECALSGYPVMESYPRQCMTAEGKLFVEEIEEDNIPQNDNEPISLGGCAVAGCSAQLCVEESEALDIITTCEYRAEYACYRETRCERQLSGQCGWTETDEFKSCLLNPPAL